MIYENYQMLHLNKSVSIFKLTTAHWDTDTKNIFYNFNIYKNIITLSTLYIIYIYIKQKVTKKNYKVRI